ncbi:MAG: GNAT family N-acetyltransferase [Armatimonadetes bacterium]|nr:GNAT family N-acetyltransferase [Armatimonadota bacterium]
MTIATRGGAVLRPAVATDWPRVDAIAIACWEPIFESYREMQGEAIYGAVTDPDGDWRQRKCDQVRGQFARAPATVWVVELAGEVLGFVTFHLDAQRSVGQIGNNGVHPDHAGQGWGTFMYRHVLQHFRARGLRFATVGTGLDRGHAAARRAYEAAGFDRAVPKVDYWQELEQLNPGSVPD